MSDQASLFGQRSVNALLRRDAHDAIARAVARGHVERAVGSLDDGAKPAVLLVEEDLLGDERAAAHGEPAAGLFLERRYQERPRPRAPLVAGHERRARRGVGHLARCPDRIGEAPRGTPESLLVRPAVVLARDDDVDL